MNPRPRVSFCLAVSHVDVELAVLWLKWAAFLDRFRPGKRKREMKLVITMTHRAHAGHATEIADAAEDFLSVKWCIRKIADEMESGYPGSSSHLFLRSLEEVASVHPGMAVMFCEPDTVPLAPDWMDRISADYAVRSAPFVGLHIPSTDDAVQTWGMPVLHVTGNAIYPPNAIELAPSIRECLSANSGPWKEKGWAWDLFCAHEIVPQSEQTNVIQQIWRSDPWTPANLSRLSPKAALFHQSKDGSLIAALAVDRYPAFLSSLPASGRCFMLETGGRSITVAGRTIPFKPVAIGIGGRILAVACPPDALDSILLVGACGRLGLSEIPKDDYDKLMAQAHRYRLD